MKRKIVWLVVSCLMMLFLLAASCGPKVEKAPPEEAAPVVLPTLSIGETARTQEIEVTVLEAIVTDKYEYYSNTLQQTVSKEASPGMSFLIITAKAKNVGATTLLSGANWFYIVDPEAHEYRLLLHYGADAMVPDRYLLPGMEMGGKALFQIPKGATSLKIKYTKVAEWEVK